MLKIIVNILVSIYTIYMTYKLYREYKEIKKLNGKVVFWLIFAVIVIPVVLYYLDKYDIASKFKLVSSNNSDRWFTFLSSYLSTIVSAIIGAIALVIMTLYQLEDQREKNLEDRRINNLPFLQYNFTTEDSTINGKTYELKTSIKNGKTIFICLEIKNIGMNTVRKCYIKPISPIIKNSYDYKLDEQELLSKNETKGITFYMNLKAKEKYSFTFIIKYQDILFNWYEQEIILDCEVVDYFSNYKCKSIINKIVKDERITENVKIDLESN